MINVENCKLLIESLKSGKWKKGRGRLRYVTDEYCCIGVACEVFDTNKIYPWILDKEIHCYSCDDTKTSAPDFVQRALGLKNYQLAKLMDLNDDSDTFDEVINQLEEWVAEENKDECSAGY